MKVYSRHYLWLYFEDAFELLQPFINAAKALTIQHMFAFQIHALCFCRQHRSYLMLLLAKEDVNMGVDSYLAHNPSVCDWSCRLTWIWPESRSDTCECYYYVEQLDYFI